MLGDFADALKVLAPDADKVSVSPDVAGIISERPLPAGGAQLHEQQTEAGTRTHISQTVSESDTVQQLIAQTCFEGYTPDDFHPPYAMALNRPDGGTVGFILFWRFRDKSAISKVTTGLLASIKPFLGLTMGSIVRHHLAARPVDVDFHERLQRIFSEYPFTPAERRTLMALMTTDSYQKASELLGVTRDTVKSHARSIYAKAGVGGHSELMVKTFTPTSV
jgi:DNA-binding CsgD family transcriptional regulator